MEKKILAAIDGSIFSSNSLDYLIRLFAQDPDFTVDLLGVVSSAGTDQNWMFDVDPLRDQNPAMEAKTRVAMKYLRDARKRLIRNGFTEEQVNIHTESSHADIAKTIYFAAQHGRYDALLIGRRGIGKVGEMFFGSVSARLIEMCHEVPLWIIDGDIAKTRFLLAVHPLPVSLLAADHLAFILRNNARVEVLLYHSQHFFGEGTTAKAEEFYNQWGKEWCDQYLDLNNHLFDAHTQILLEGGLDREQIHQLPVQKDIDASHDLLRQAREHHCGTIVLGRRGREVSKGLLGGVSDRTTNKAQNQAIWLVG